MENKIKECKNRKKTFYEKYMKRGMDIICVLLALIVFGWLYVVIAILVKVKLGSPIIFKQYRPGLNETLFPIYKFRSMTDAKDERGDLLPDAVRLTAFGKWLRRTSLDELPEAFNILRGDMSIVGPRPQLVKDMVFMSENQRRRHLVRPGLSGLAQVNGRNSICWEDKLSYDLSYIQKITFMDDFRIVVKTVLKAFVKTEGINREGTASDMDFGDYLLKNGEVTKDTYLRKQKIAAEILSGSNQVREESDLDDELVSIIMPSYNSECYIGPAIQSVQKQTYQKWELLIVDDCSVDHTVQMIKQIKDHRIRLFINDKNSGAAVSRNKALREAKGRWIAFLDSDDLWVPQKLEKQLQFMRNQGYAFTYTDYRTQLNGKWLPYIVTAPDIITRKKMYDYCYFSTITVIYDQTKVGLIQIEDLRKNNDYAMWLKAVEKVNCYRYPECLSYYIKHDGSVSSGKKIKLIQWHYILFRKGLHKTCLMSCILTMNNLFHGVIKKVKYRKKVKAVPKGIGD